MFRRRWQGIVGQRFSPSQFEEYVKEIKSFPWNPIGVTIHHTAIPDSSMRPNGFTAQHMKNLESYYKEDLGWASAPHGFTDQNGIWVFTPLTVRGTHAVSFNRTHFGIEMLGDYDEEDPLTSKSVQNGIQAAAILLKRIGKTEDSLNFHRDDKKTSKSCPGGNISKEWFKAAVEAAIDGHGREQEDKVLKIFLNDVDTGRTCTIPARGTTAISTPMNLWHAVYPKWPVVPERFRSQEAVGVRSLLESWGFTVVANLDTLKLKVYTKG